MFSPRPPQRLPYDASPDLRSWARHVIDTLDASSRAVSFYDVGGGMPTQGTMPWDFIYGIIIEENGSGVGSGAGAGFFDEEGFIAYSFEQVYDDRPWQGRLIPHGIKTDVPSENNYAYPLNREELSAGTIVLLKRVKNHWIIVGGAGTAAGSGGAINLNFTCNNDGTGGTITG